jgi:hypothetical protein
MLLVMGLKKYRPSGSDSDTISPKRVLMPRWPVSTTLMPQPAKLRTTTPTMAMPTQVKMVRNGGPLRPSELPGPRKTGDVKAMDISPC